jgi:hypothetical protein
MITAQELREPIACDDVDSWIESLLQRFHVSEEWKTRLKLRKKPVDEIVYELVPLSKYINAFHKTPDLKLYYFPGSSQSFDAEIRKLNGELVERIEVTMAIDGYGDTIRTECLLEHGIAPIIKTPEFTGLSKNRVISVNTSCIADSEDVILNYASLIKDAFKKKQENIDKYPNTTLLIGIEVQEFFLEPWEFDVILESVKIPKDTFDKIILVNVSSDQYWRLKK